jgi:hypothetical protein
VFALLLLGAPSIGATEVEGSFLLDGQDAGLAHVRAAATELAPGTPGYVVLLSAEPAEGDPLDWRSADPAERGAFVVLLLEENGAVWVAELGHPAAASGRFGVVTEVAVEGFEAKDGRVSGRLASLGEQSFGEDRFRIDLRFDAKLEP